MYVRKSSKSLSGRQTTRSFSPSRARRRASNAPDAAGQFPDPHPPSPSVPLPPPSSPPPSPSPTRDAPSSCTTKADLISHAPGTLCCCRRRRRRHICLGRVGCVCWRARAHKVQGHPACVVVASDRTPMISGRTAAPGWRWSRRGCASSTRPSSGRRARSRSCPCSPDR